MYQEAFKKLELDETATILDSLNPEFDGTVFDPVETVILAQDVSFYKDYRFLDIADHQGHPAMHRYVIYKSDHYSILNFTNEPIYALNQSAPITLNKDNIDDYVLFFFSYVRGRHGRFLIVESVDNINWREDPPPSARKALGEMITPITLENTDKEGNYNLNACMVFKDSLFKSKIKVTPGGQVSLSDEELLVEDLPVLDDTFGQ